MTSSEETINELLGAMLKVRQRLTLRHRELLDEGVAQDGATIEVSVFSQGDTPFFGIEGYLDTPLGDRGSAVWSLDCWREGAGWRVTRGVTLYPPQGGDLLNKLPQLTYTDSRELAAALPGLVDEVLDVQVPEPGAPS